MAASRDVAVGPRFDTTSARLIDYRTIVLTIRTVGVVLGAVGGMLTAAARSNTSQTLDRGLRVLEVIATADEAPRIDELASRIEVHRSIAYRIVRTLELHALDLARLGRGRAIRATSSPSGRVPAAPRSRSSLGPSSPRWLMTCR